MKRIRIYQNTALSAGAVVILEDSASHYLTKVLRVLPNQPLILLNGDGLNYAAEIVKTGKVCVAKVLNSSPNLCESTLNLTLAQCIPKGDKMGFLMQKATELGVRKILPIVSERCTVKLTGDRAQKRQNHWQKIVISACEQSGRSVIPRVEMPIKLADFLRIPVQNGFVLNHRSAHSLLTVERCREATILIGPEGGLSADELKCVAANGYQSLQLGGRVLRTETASLVALANMQLLWGS